MKDRSAWLKLLPGLTGVPLVGRITLGLSTTNPSMLLLLFLACVVCILFESAKFFAVPSWLQRNLNRGNYGMWGGREKLFPVFQSDQAWENR